MAEKKRKTTTKKQTAKKPAKKPAKKASKKTVKKTGSKKQSATKPSSTKKKSTKVKSKQVTKIKVTYKDKPQSIPVSKPAEAVNIKITHFLDQISEPAEAQQPEVPTATPTKIEVREEGETSVKVETHHAEAEDPPRQQEVTVKDLIERETDEEVVDTHPESPAQSAHTSDSQAEIDLPQPDKEPELDDAPVARQPTKKVLPKPKFRRSLVLVATGIAVIAGLLVIPTIRFQALNLAGFRTTATFEVLDSQTRLPLSDVVVQLDGMQETTDDSGAANFTDVRFGGHTVAVQKKAYREHSDGITIGHGTNIFNNILLEATGKQFELKLTDWLSQESLTDGSVTYGEYHAKLDNNGVARLNVPQDVASRIEVTARANGYRQQTLTLDTASGDVVPVAMVIDGYHYFVSDRAGTLDVYQVNPDGTGEQMIIKATGDETDQMLFEISPSRMSAALVASRDAATLDQEGNVLRGLYIVDLATSQLKRIDESEQIDLIGWIGEAIVYVKVQVDAGGQDPQRHRLLSYDTADSQLVELAASNFFNDVLVAGEHVFYAPSDAYKSEPQAHLFRVRADGSDQTTLLERTAWTIRRTGIDALAFDVEQEWYQGSLAGIELEKLTKPPQETASRLYILSPDKTKSAWISVSAEDEQLAVLNQDGDTTTDYKIDGLRYPVRWLNNTHLVFRVDNQQETADYIVDIRGGQPQKLSNVSNVGGIDRWYYYY